jgi:hypothetical protein
MRGLNALLADLYNKPRSLQRDIIIVNALIGAYSDFDSTHDYPPTMMLALDLSYMDCDDMVYKVHHGEYDHDYGMY